MTFRSTQKVGASSRLSFQLLSGWKHVLLVVFLSLEIAETDFVFTLPSAAGYSLLISPYLGSFKARK